MKLVPLEPTQEMIQAIIHALDGVNLSKMSRHERARYKAIARHKAMIAAAPAEPDPAADPRLVREFREADETPAERLRLWCEAIQKDDLAAIWPDDVRKVLADLAALQFDSGYYKELFESRNEAFRDAWHKLEASQERVRELEERMDQIESWCKAYPISIFTEPDFEKVRELLGDNLLTQVSASNMRHVVDGIGKIISGRDAT